MRYTQYGIDHPDLDQPILVARHTGEILAHLCGGRLMSRIEVTGYGRRGPTRTTGRWQPVTAATATAVSTVRQAAVTWT